jgi:hypothetical protein
MNLFTNRLYHPGTVRSVAARTPLSTGWSRPAKIHESHEIVALVVPAPGALASTVFSRFESRGTATDVIARVVAGVLKPRPFPTAPGPAGPRDLFAGSRLVQVTATSIAHLNETKSYNHQTDEPPTHGFPPEETLAR